MNYKPGDVVAHRVAPKDYFYIIGQNSPYTYLLSPLYPTADPFGNYIQEAWSGFVRDEFILITSIFREPGGLV